jgi:Protein of unknown function (DUF3617)
MRLLNASMLTGGVAILAASLVLASDAPPIKPGLWQVTTEAGADGQKMPDPSAMLEKMPPEMREKMAAMMKERGVDMSGGAGGTKICMTRDSLDQGKWQSPEISCTTTYGARTSSSWKWHSVCTKPVMTSDGEAEFSNPENYTVKTSSTMQIMGQAKTTQRVIHSKWLSADCGGLKPINELLKKP